MLDPVKVEAAEVELNRFIERRAKQSAAEREREDLWAESVRRHHEKRRQANRLAWLTTRARRRVSGPL